MVFNLSLENNTSTARREVLGAFLTEVTQRELELVSSQKITKHRHHYRSDILKSRNAEMEEVEDEVSTWGVLA